MTLNILITQIFIIQKELQGVDFRAKNYDSIENLEKNSLDFYASVKSLYLQDRQQKILKFKKIISTQDDSDWEEIKPIKINFYKDEKNYFIDIFIFSYTKLMYIQLNQMFLFNQQ